MSLKGESKVPTAKKDVITVVLTPETYHEWKEEAGLVIGVNLAALRIS
jgi:hypothetical protein